jgi:DNA-binding HxlR family transcriptional regulator
MYRIENKEYPCSTSLTMKFIGGKWKAVILMHLIKPKRYHQLRKELPMVTDRTIGLQLKELEEDGLISRKVFTDKPLKVEYAMTEFGRTLIPLLTGIAAWGKKAASRHERIEEFPDIENLECSIIEQ